MDHPNAITCTGFIAAVAADGPPSFNGVPSGVPELA